MGGVLRIGGSRLNHKRGGPCRVIAPARENVGFHPLNVDLEPMDRIVTHEVENACQSNCWNHDFAGSPPGCPVAFSDLYRSGRQARFWDFVELERSRRVRNSGLYHDFIGACRSDGRRVGRGRFDMHTAPSALVKGQANRIINRVLRSDIEVPASPDVAKCAPKAYVLEVLCV